MILIERAGQCGSLSTRFHFSEWSRATFFRAFLAVEKSSYGTRAFQKEPDKGQFVGDGLAIIMINLIYQKSFLMAFYRGCSYNKVENFLRCFI